MVKRVQTQTLKQIAIFAGLRLDTLDFMLSRSTRIKFATGEYFFREADIGQELFVIESGAVRVIKHRDGDEVELATFGVGDCVGEMSLLAVMPRSASVVAKVDCIAIRMTSADLLALYEHDVEQFSMMTLNMAREVARRLWVANEMLYGYIGFFNG